MWRLQHMRVSPKSFKILSLGVACERSLFLFALTVSASNSAHFFSYDLHLSAITLPHVKHLIGIIMSLVLTFDTSSFL